MLIFVSNADEFFKIEQGLEIQRPTQLVVRVPNEEIDQVLDSRIVRLTAEGTFFLS